MCCHGDAASCLPYHLFLQLFDLSSLDLNALLQLLVPLSNIHRQHEIHNGTRLRCWRKYNNATGSTAGAFNLMPGHTEACVGQPTWTHLMTCTCRSAGGLRFATDSEVLSSIFVFYSFSLIFKRFPFTSARWTESSTWLDLTVFLLYCFLIVFMQTPMTLY